MELTKQELLLQKQGFQAQELTETKYWQEVLKPRLELAARSSLVDPRSFKSDEEYLYAQKVAWAHSSAANEILEAIDQDIETAIALTKKEKGEIKDKLREGVS